MWNITLVDSTGPSTFLLEPEYALTGALCRVCETASLNQPCRMQLQYCDPETHHTHDQWAD